MAGSLDIDIAKLDPCISMQCKKQDQGASSRIQRPSFRQTANHRTETGRATNLTALHTFGPSPGACTDLETQLNLWFVELLGAGSRVSPQRLYKVAFPLLMGKRV